MHSRTKRQISEQQLRQMIEAAGIKDVINAEELTGGEFNLAYMIHTKTEKYIIKIAPETKTFTLTHEQNIMDTELWVYEQIRKHTDIKIPDIIYSSKKGDPSYDIIDSPWFVMTVLPGKLLCHADLNNEQLYHWQYQFGQALAGLHNIKNDRYGFRQVRLHDTWKDAYYDMIFTLIEDADRQGNMLPELSAILRFIRRWEGALEEVKCPRLIHYDLFRNNVFAAENGDFAGLIDTERAFFGDYYADFFAIDYLGQLEDNKGLIAGYNSAAEEKIEFTPYARARVALSRLLLGIIMFTEGTTRLALSDPQHWKRKHLASVIIDYALHELD